MSAVSYKIPLVPWVRRTIAKMNAIAKDDSKTWSRFWLQTYSELGGKKKNSGSKPCPKLAAYGLWRLGWIAESGKPFQDWAIEKIRREIGKNAVYALLTVDLLDRGWDARDINRLWCEAQTLYEQILAEPPSRNQQGAVKVASTLYVEGQIVSRLKMRVPITGDQSLEQQGTTDSCI